MSVGISREHCFRDFLDVTECAARLFRARKKRPLKRTACVAAIRPQRLVIVMVAYRVERVAITARSSDRVAVNLSAIDLVRRISVEILSALSRMAHREKRCSVSL